MPFKFRRCVMGLVATVFANLVFAADADQPVDVVSTVLLQSDHSWDGQGYVQYPAGSPQLTILRIVIPAHTVLPWHSHPIPNAAYVISGTLRVESEDGHNAATLHAGDVLPEMVGRSHRGLTDESPVELIVFYAGAKGIPLSQKSH